MTSTGFPCQREFHASCIVITSTDASKMAAVLNSPAHPRKKKTDTAKGTWPPPNTLWEKQTFSILHQASRLLFNVNQAQDKSQAWQSERRRTVWRNLPCLSDIEFASGWSWYRAYFSRSSMLHAKLLINQGFSSFWQTGSSLQYKIHFMPPLNLFWSELFINIHTILAIYRGFGDFLS